MIKYHKDEVCFWFRVFGYGLTIINRDRQPTPFSIRSGNVKEWRVGKWGVKILWRGR